MAETDKQNQESREKRAQELGIVLELLVHASQCRSPVCNYPRCRKVINLFLHGIICKIQYTGGCDLCKRMWNLLQLHARACKESACLVPHCKELKEHMMI